VNREVHTTTITRTVTTQMNNIIGIPFRTIFFFTPEAEQ